MVGVESKCLVSPCRVSEATLRSVLILRPMG